MAKLWPCDFCDVDIDADELRCLGEDDEIYVCESCFDQASRTLLDLFDPKSESIPKELRSNESN